MDRSVRSARSSPFTSTRRSSNKPAVKCPYCSTLETKVVDSRLNQTGDITRRRRECSRCEGRFTTYERVEEVMPLVIKKDGRREVFSRLKLQGALAKACQKRNIATEKLEAIVTLTERRIQSYGLKEIPSRTIGLMLMNELLQLDKVAYVRFASVYREFKDVDEFVAELKDPSEPSPDVGSLSFPFAGPPES